MRDPAYDVTCPECDGEGEVECSECDGSGECASECDCCGSYNCQECRGSGKVQCPTCDGSGEVEPSTARQWRDDDSADRRYDEWRDR